MTEEKLYDTRREIANFLKLRRKQLGITQQQLADLCGVNIITVIRTEGAKFFLSTKQLILFCEALDCELKLLPKNKSYF